MASITTEAVSAPVRLGLVSTYGRGAVTVEPVRAIERDLHLVFRDAPLSALETLHLFRQ